MTGTEPFITKDQQVEDTVQAHVGLMEQTLHPASSVDLRMDTTEDNHMKGMTMENTHRVDTSFSAGLSEETQLLTISGPSSSSGKVRVRSRPRLQWTKSFPPYSQCIGGLGECDSGLVSETSIPHQQQLCHDEMMREDRNERKEGVAPSTRSVRDEMRAKWRTRRRERLGGSHDEEGRDERKRSPFSADWKEKVERRNDGEEAEELPRTHQRSYPHPILSKLLHSSSSTSSCSSISLSSAESDDIFSEGEDVDNKRKRFKKCHSWKTYMTMMHWSLRRQSSWVQLAGHQGNFQPSEGGEVLKLYSEEEAKCFDSLMRDPLRPFVPQYHGMVTREGHCYIRLEDLLTGLGKPVIMDCKMGVRTYQEEELAKARTKATLRSDMYQKMVEIDPSALSSEEHAQGGVNKWRYLQWRDTTTSTSALGFRIEGIMTEDGSVQRDFRKIQTLAQVTDALLYFTRSQLDILKAYHSRLLALNDALMNSPFFRTHEVIGSSLLFVHNYSSKASVWMIDFGKTTPLHDTVKLRHNIPWAEGSREDGYLIGLTSLIMSLSQAISVASSQQEGSTREEESVT